MINYTPKQREIMGIVKAHFGETGMAPTLEEIGNAMGVHRVTVHQHITALIRKGALKKLPQRSRSLRIMDPDFMVNRVERIVLSRRQDTGSYQVQAIDDEAMVTYGKTRSQALGEFLKLHHERMGIAITDESERQAPSGAEFPLPGTDHPPIEP